MSDMTCRLRYPVVSEVSLRPQPSLIRALCFGLKTRETPDDLLALCFDLKLRATPDRLRVSCFDLDLGWTPESLRVFRDHRLLQLQKR